jgi:hypothetical protein
MAYMNQDKKAMISPVVKAILKKYKVKGTLAVRNHSTLVLNIKSGSIDFIDNFNNTVSNTSRYLASPQNFRKAEGSLDVNPYWYHEHFNGTALECLKEIMTAMNDGNHDNSDIQSDYFDVGWYVDINIGQWNKPYEVA